MAYPSIGTAQADSPANPNFSSSITGLGSPPTEPVQQPNPAKNKVEMLINDFGNIFSQLNNLAGQYPAAGDKFNLVVESLKNWLAKASDSIVSEGGGNSITY